MSPHDCYKISAHKNLEASLRDFAAGDYACCCERMATASEMVGSGMLIHKGICVPGKIYSTYGHSIRGRFQDLYEHDAISEEDLGSVLDCIFCVPPFAEDKHKKRHIKQKEFDNGSNAFKYENFNKHRTDPCPHHWVSEQTAAKIVHRTAPVLRALIDSLP